MKNAKREQMDLKGQMHYFQLVTVVKTQHLKCLVSSRYWIIYLP